MTLKTSQVVIAGAGIVGAAGALALAREGLRVLVADAGPPGGGATAAGMGHLVLMDDSEAQLALTSRSLRLWHELAPSLPRACEFMRCGTLWVAADEAEMAEVERKRQRYRRFGWEAEVLDGRSLHAAEPNLRPGLAGGLRVPGDCAIYPPAAARWLLEEARRSGAEARLGQEVIELSGREARLSDGTRISAEFTVNAAGARAARLTPGLPIRPRKGHLVITDRYPEFIRHQLVELGYLKSAGGSEEESVAFNVQPRITGQLLIGSSRQFGAAGGEVDWPMVQRMAGRALEYIPGLRKLSAVRIWTGFRAATPDSLPLIGPLPEEPGLYLASGHEGLGITTSLATAELLVHHLTGKPAALPPEPYLPARFHGKAAHG